MPVFFVHEFLAFTHKSKMVEISKHLFDSFCRDLSCSQIAHPWTRSCFDLRHTLQFFIGSAKFYLPIHLAIILKGKKLRTREDVFRALESYLRSTLLGTLVCSTSIIGACFFRWTLGGRFNYYTYILIPTTLNGLFILLEPASRRGLVFNLFCNLVIEYWLRSLQRKGFIRITNTKMTLLFMLGSSLLFYLMRLEGEKKTRTPLLWLFTPEKVRHKVPGEQNPCPHEGPCSKHILKGTATYFSTGLAFTLVSLLGPFLRSPATTLSNLGISHLRLATFFGSYIGIYRLIICWLCRKTGHDSAAHALPAGAVAGLSFLLKPSLGVSIAALSGAFKVFSTVLYEKKVITERVDLPVLLYCISQGILFHARCMHPDVCPSYVFNLIKTTTNGYVDVAFAKVVDAIKER